MLAIAGHLPRRSGRGRHEAAGVRVPIGCPNPRGFPGKAGESYSSPQVETPLFPATLRTESGPHVLLAMQKVVGSNPISRFAEGLHLQVFFVAAVALFLCIRSD